MKYSQLSNPVKWMISITALIIIFTFPIYLELSKQGLIETSIPDLTADKFQALYLFILAVPVYWSYNLIKWRNSDSIENITTKNKWIFITILSVIGASIVFAFLFAFNLIYVFNVYLYIADTLSFFVSGFISSNYELI
jgi:magnesium-transporting ATPase (P-type)